MSTYPYATGNLIENRNTYFYSSYEGESFLEAWRESRQNILGQIPSKDSAIPRAVILFSFDEVLHIWNQEGRIQTEFLLEVLLERLECSENDVSQGLQRYIDQLVKRFEVSKRIHEALTKDFKPVDKDRYHNLNLYLRTAEIFSLTYEKIGQLTYLNAFLKILDTLCGFFPEFHDEQKVRLSYLIQKEQEFIRNISKFETVNS